MVADKVRDLIEKEVNLAGYFIDDVEYVKESGNYFLRVIIYKKGILDVEDCVTVSNIINPILDDIDFITDSYILDVCSKEEGCE